jgi:hypothetical protein
LTTWWCRAAGQWNQPIERGRCGSERPADNGAQQHVSVVYKWTNASPAGQVVINEIMYNPVVNNAQFVELYNNSTNTDL